MTLIEVLAGLVVLGTLLVAVSIARGRFLTQWADADKKLVAIHSADLLLAHWLTDPIRNVPLSGAGPLAGAPGFYWRTVVLPDPASAKLGALTVRLEVFDHRPSSIGGSMNLERSNLPMLSVDILFHKLTKPQALAPVPAGTNGPTGSR